MFCPNCRAEYREGYTRCSDCGVWLVEVPPPPGLHKSELCEDDRPDFAMKSHFLAWFVPLVIFLLLMFGIMLRPSLLQNSFVAAPLIIGILVSNFGSYWMIYQSIRYERRVGRYVLLSFIPFMFIWYSLVRVPLRKEFQGTSPFIR